MAAESAGRQSTAILERLALASTTLHPDDIATLVAQEVSGAGLGDARLYLACLEQRELIPLPARGETPSTDNRIDIDDSPAGTAYRSELPVVEAGDEAETVTVWLPLMDSAERLGVMALTTNTMADDQMRLCQAIANLTGELISNKTDYGDLITQTRRTRPVTVAAELRWSMLPPLTFTGQNLTITGIVAPAYEIAGDTFDYAVNGDVAHLTILDAVGHGLEAARIANLAIGVYRHSRRSRLDPAHTYRSMNETIAAQFGPEKFATAQVATLQLSTGRLRWVNAGHPTPMVIRGAHRIDLPSHVWLPVGLADPESGEPPTSEAHLQPGDLVVFFTDGVVEARSASGVEFGRDRLGALLERAVALGEKPAETLRVVSHELLSHQPDKLRDDATLLLLSWDGPPD